MVIPLQDDLLRFVTDSLPPLITFNPAPASVSHPHEGAEVGDQLFVPDLVSFVHVTCLCGTDRFVHRVRIRFGD
jgi:hypothetical protein